MVLLGDPIELLKQSFESKNLSEVTQKRWMYVATDFLDFIGKKDVTFASADGQAVKDYLGYKKRTVSGNGMKTIHYILKSMYMSWGKKWELGKGDVPHGREPERPFFTVEEIRKIITAGKERAKERGDYIGMRDLVMLLISTETGVRRIQIHNLDLEHFTKDKLLKIPPAKGGRWTDRKLRDDTVRYLELYLIERRKFLGETANDPKSPLFLDRSKTRVSTEAMGWGFIDIKNKAGIDKPGGSFHGMRRSKTTRLHKGGMSETEITEALGWKKGSREPGIYIQLDQKEVQEKANKADKFMSDDEL